MGLLLSRVRIVFTAIRGLLLGVQPPRMFRAQFGAESGGSFPVTVFWSAPATWGNDQEGTEQRSYQGEYRQVLNANGSLTTGNISRFDGNPTFTRLENQSLQHVNPAAPEGSVWETRIRSRDKKGEYSDWVTIRYHAVEQEGALLLSHRYLRISNRRLRLT